jgi:hypothetical protein
LPGSVANDALALPSPPALLPACHPIHKTTTCTATALYAPDKNAAMQSIADIRAIFDGLAP